MAYTYNNTKIPLSCLIFTFIPLYCMRGFLVNVWVPFEGRGVFCPIYTYKSILRGFMQVMTYDVSQKKRQTRSGQVITFLVHVYSTLAMQNRHNEIQNDFQHFFASPPFYFHTFSCSHFLALLFLLLPHVSALSFPPFYSHLRAHHIRKVMSTSSHLTLTYDIHAYTQSHIHTHQF